MSSDKGSLSSPVSTESLAHKDILPSGDSAGYSKSFYVSSEIVKPQKEAVAKSEMTCKQCREHLKVDPRSSSTQKIPETVDLESPRSWGMAHPATYNEKIQRQLNQVAEPPSADGMEDFTTQMTPPNKPDLVSNIGRMCPLCSKMYYATSTFEEFSEHVHSHFGEEDEELDSVINNFEIINN
uniref:UBZ1-type domain-containing protein n=1 Tax=Timema monikensis TaxID=170555 RepID=A0A7R9HQW4_9NEOP|nr:unnamed protein product [Timema monikensis]